MRRFTKSFYPSLPLGGLRARLSGRSTPTLAISRKRLLCDTLKRSEITRSAVQINPTIPTSPNLPHTTHRATKLSARHRQLALSEPGNSNSRGLCLKSNTLHRRYRDASSSDNRTSFRVT